MEKKCNCEQKQAVKGEKIVLKWNTDFFDNIKCFLCDEITTPDGLDFVIEGTEDFVCLDCAKKKVPDLYTIHNQAHLWQEVALEKAFEKGVKCGKTTAGQMILDAITEPILNRVERVCRVNLGAKPCEEYIPF